VTDGGEETVTLDELVLLLPTLTRREVTALAYAVLGLRTPEQLRAIPLADRLKAGLWEFMAAVGFVTDAQRRQVLDRLGPALQGVLPAYRAGGGRLPPFFVTFAEQRYVTYPAAGVWYDFHFDRSLEELPEPAVLLVTCDLTALFLRQNAWLARARGRTPGPGDGGASGRDGHATERQ